MWRRFMTLIVSAGVVALLIVLWVPKKSPAPWATEHVLGDMALQPDDVGIQTKCLAAGRTLYTSLGYPRGRISGYGTHYNHTLGKCFLDVTTVDGSSGQPLLLLRQVFEAPRGTKYAIYSGPVRRDTLALGTPPVECEVTLLS